MRFGFSICFTPQNLEPENLRSLLAVSKAKFRKQNVRDTNFFYPDVKDNFELLFSFSSYFFFTCDCASISLLLCFENSIPLMHTLKKLLGNYSFTIYSNSMGRNTVHEDRGSISRLSEISGLKLSDPCIYAA